MARINCLRGLRTSNAVRSASPASFPKETTPPTHHHHTTHNHRPTPQPSETQRGATTPTSLEHALFGEAIPKLDGEMEKVRLEVLETMRNRWAHSTTTQRNMLYDELLETAAQTPTLQLQTIAALMIQKKSVTNQTKLTYAKNLHAILRQMNQDTHLLSTFIAGLRAMGAEIPTKQAEPITREVVQNIVCPLPVKVALILAWKTASRIDEIAKLKPENIIESSPEEIIIWFGVHTKTSRSRPFMPQLFQVIKGKMTDFLHENLPAALQQWPTTATIKKHIPKPYTMHSIKHGAGQEIIKLAAERKIDPSIIPLVLKHASAQKILSETTIRYMSQNKADLARTFRTGEVTALL